MTRWLVALALVATACGSGASPEEPIPTTPDRIPTPSTTTATTVATTSTTAIEAEPTTTSTDPVTPTDEPECPAPAAFSGGGAEIWSQMLQAFDADGAPLWQMRLPDGYGHMTFDGAPYIIATGRFGIAAIDAMSCEVLWEAQTIDSITIATTSETSFVYTTNRNLVRVSHEFDVLWDIEVPSVHDLVVLGELVLLSTADGRLQVRHLIDGALVADHLLPGSGKFLTVDAARGAVFASGPHVVVTDVAGSPIGEFDAAGDVVSALFVDDQRVAIASTGLALHEIATGSQSWTRSLEPTREPMVLDHREIHVLTTEGALQHYSLGGDLIFSGPHASAQTYVDVGRVIEVTSDGRLTAYTMLEQADWSLQLEGPDNFVADIVEIGDVRVLYTHNWIDG